MELTTRDIKKGTEIKNLDQNMVYVELINKKKNSNVLLNNVSFTVPTGSICAFIGQSGAGKTTTIKALMGLYTIDSGKILLCGYDYKDPMVHYKVGYVPEKENFPKITARRFLLQMTDFYDIPREMAETKIDQYAQMFNLKDKMTLSLHKMSSGQKKRVMVIQSLLHSPDLLIMDEPTENMDPDNREVFYVILKKLKELNKTVLISTHNLAEIESKIDHAIVITNGTIQYCGEIKGKEHLRNIYDKYKPQEKKIEIEL